jgi:hypothetical protein
MWLCPRCKVYMELGGQANCIECSKEIQYFENIENIPLESMIVMVKLSEYFIIKKD